MTALLDGPPPMAKKKPERKPDKEPTDVLRVRVATLDMIREIAEARGQSLPEAVDVLLGPGLDAEHKAIQPLLRQVREQRKKLERLQEQARQGRAG